MPFVFTPSEWKDKVGEWHNNLAGCRIDFAMERDKAVDDQRWAWKRGLSGGCVRGYCKVM